VSESRIMTIHLKSGVVIAVEVSKEWKVSQTNNVLTQLVYPNAEGKDNGLRYICLDDVSAVFVR
jgi:hypothetical protein